MVWQVEFEPAARKALRKIDRTWQERIVKYLDEVSNLDDPRVRGKALTSDFSGLWRYRVGDYRIVCEFENDILIIAVIKVAHRRQVYD